MRAGDPRATTHVVTAIVMPLNRSDQPQRAYDASQCAPQVATLAERGSAAVNLRRIILVRRGSALRH
jgi:hypothetical protein